MLDASAPREVREGGPKDSTVTAVLGPTNTGKTHYAIDRMLSHRSGIIGFPLRLLAREGYDRIVAMRGAFALSAHFSVPKGAHLSLIGPSCFCARCSTARRTASTISEMRTSGARG